MDSISWSRPKVTSRNRIYFGILPYGQAEDTASPSLPRVLSSILQRHPWTSQSCSILGLELPTRSLSLYENENIIILITISSMFHYYLAKYAMIVVSESLFSDSLLAN